VKTSKVHVSLAIQYTADAIVTLAELIDRDEIDEGALKAKIAVAKIALDRALQTLDAVPMPEGKD